MYQKKIKWTVEKNHKETIYIPQCDGCPINAEIRVENGANTEATRLMLMAFETAYNVGYEDGVNDSYTD
jgi:hypothetical protein